MEYFNKQILNFFRLIYQVVIAQWLALRLVTREGPGSNPGKGENLIISDKIGKLII